MNKSEMAEKLAGKCDISQAKAAEIINCIFDTKPGSGIIAVELDADRDVSIAGFGKFETRRRQPDGFSIAGPWCIGGLPATKPSCLGRLSAMSNQEMRSE